MAKSVHTTGGDKGPSFFLGKVLVTKKNGRAYLQEGELVSGSIPKSMEMVSPP